MAIIDKGNLMLMLGEDLDSFTGFLFSPAGAMTKWQFEQAVGFDMDSPILQQKMANLVKAGIIKQETFDKILSLNGTKNTDSSSVKKWDISSIAGDIPKWVYENIQPFGTPYSISGDVVVTTGVLPAKEIT